MEVQAQAEAFAQETPVTDRKRLHDKADNQAREDASIRQPDFIHENQEHDLQTSRVREPYECTASLKRKRAEQEEREKAAATASHADLANEGTAPSSSAEAKASKEAAATSPSAARFFPSEATATEQAADAAPLEAQEGPYKGQKRARLVLSTGLAAAVRQADGAKQRIEQEIQAVDRVMEAALIKNRVDEVGTLTHT